jgi:hypothetical protein
MRHLSIRTIFLSGYSLMSVATILLVLLTIQLHRAQERPQAKNRKSPTAATCWPMNCARARTI